MTSLLFFELVLLLSLAAVLLAGVATYLVFQKKSVLAVLPLVPAVFLVIVAMAGSWLAAKKTEREVKAGWRLVPVLVASRNLAAGDVLTSDAVTDQPIPEQFITPSVFHGKDRDQAFGHSVIAPVKRGEPITRLLLGMNLMPCEGATP